MGLSVYIDMTDANLFLSMTTSPKSIAPQGATNSCQAIEDQGTAYMMICTKDGNGCIEEKNYRHDGG